MLSSMARHLSHLLAPSLLPRSFLPSPISTHPICFFLLSPYIASLTWKVWCVLRISAIQAYANQPRWSSYATWFASLAICLLASLFYNSVHPDVHLSLPLELLPCAHTASRLLAISPESVSHSTRHSFPLSFFLSSPPQSHQQLFALISAAHSQKCSTC